MISFSIILNKINNKNNNFQPFWEHPSYMENWRSIYKDRGLISTLIQGMFLLNGSYILKHNIPNVEEYIQHCVINVFIKYVE